jgi:hypothetical protein
MRFTLAFLILAGTTPSAAQSADRFRRMPVMPPEIISHDKVIRDAARLDPAHVRAETDNETTRVLRVTLEPARQIPVHDDRAGVLVCLTDCHLLLTHPDGRAEELNLRAGQTSWLQEGRRSTRNIGPASVEMLYIEAKKPQG